MASGADCRQVGHAVGMVALPEPKVVHAQDHLPRLGFAVGLFYLPDG